MNKFIIILFLSLTACSTVVPVKYKFPEVPETLMMPTEPLVTLDKDKKQLSDLIENAAHNYGKYYELEIKYKAWQEWYTNQKEISEKTQ